MQDPIPLLAPERPMNGPEGQQLLQVAQQVLTSGRYILGAEVEAFEKSMAAWLQAPYALGVSSGTDALLLALMAVGLRQGDQVICPSYTFFATAGVIERLGAKPVFVDSCPACMTLDVQQVAQAITPLTRAIIPVHLFGHGANIAPIMTLGELHGVAVVEDAAQAMGTRIAGSQAATVGDMGCLSFFPSKNLGGFGDGGMVVTHDAELFARASALRVHGAQTPRYLHRHVGGNFRLDALQAALLRQRLPEVHGMLQRRAAHAASYRAIFEASGLAAPRYCGCAAGGAMASIGPAAAGAMLTLPTFSPGDTVNQYVITLPSQHLRDRLQNSLQAEGIGNSIYYPLPLHMQPCFAHLGYRPLALPVALHLSKTALALPVAPELTPQEIERVAAAVLKGIGS